MKKQLLTKTPSYRVRKGYTQAIVTLTDSATGKRKDFWLGEYNTPESREAYHRVIALWEANARRFPPQEATRSNVLVQNSGPCVSEIILEYWRWAQGYYRPKHVQSLAGALKLIKQYFGRSAAEQFGPNNLRLLRDAMIRGDASATPPRSPWTRKYINSQIQRLRHMFKWAAAREFVPASVHQSLCTLESLRRGRSGAKENPRVGPVPQHFIDVVRRHFNRPVGALVELQLLTGARPGELLGLRAIDIEIDPKSEVWTYRPEVHKNSYREKDRVVYFGPKSQEVLRPFMADRATDTFLFSPIDAEATRRQKLTLNRTTPASCGNVPGSNRREQPKRQPQERYTTNSYCRAIQYACDRAFPPPCELSKRDGETTRQWQARLTQSEKWSELLAWRRDHRFHPHQLRHNAATTLRRQFGLEAAQLALGHASAQITDAVYAERDRTKIIEIMRHLG